MVLVRLCCGLMVVDIADRFGISEAHVSCILATWLEFLYHELRALPIWGSCDYIQQTMPQPFKETYQNNCVIIDCTELYVIIDCTELIEMPTSFRSQSAFFENGHFQKGDKLLIYVILVMYACNQVGRCIMLNRLETLLTHSFYNCVSY